MLYAVSETITNLEVKEFMAVQRIKNKDVIINQFRHKTEANHVCRHVDQLLITCDVG